MNDMFFKVKRDFNLAQNRMATLKNIIRDKHIELEKLSKRRKVLRIVISQCYTNSIGIEATKEELKVINREWKAHRKDYNYAIQERRYAHTLLQHEWAIYKQAKLKATKYL